MSSYLAVFRIGSIRRMLFAAFLGRAPTGILGLAAIFLVHQQGRSFAVAGAVGGAVGLGIALSAVVQARLIRRWGNWSLAAAASGHIVLGVLTALGAIHRWPVIALGVIGLAFGSSLPATSSIIRGLYPGLVPDRPDLHSTAFALDAALTDTSYVVGPAVVSAMLALGSPESAIGISIAAALIAVIALLRMDSRAEPAEAVRPGLHASTRDLGLLRLLAFASFPVGFGWGIYDVAFPAFATAHHSPPLGGILLALVSFASVCGSLSYGAASTRIAASGVLVAGSILYPMAFALPLLGTTFVTMCFLAAPSGLVNGSWVAGRNHFLNTNLSEELRATANAWALLAVYLGTAAGQSVGGTVVAAIDWRAGAAVACAGIALIPALLVSSRGFRRA